MVHVDEWLETVGRECRAAGVRWKNSSSYISPSMANRMRREYSLADTIVVPSLHAKSTFEAAGIESSRLAVIPYGVDMPQRRFRPSRDPRLTVLYAGRLELLKGIRHLLDGWTAAGLADARLVLVGAMGDAVGVIERQSSKSVIAVGSVPQAEMIRWYNSADLFVFPSLADGFGLVLLEAMAAGVPCLASRLSGGPDCIVDGENGFLLDEVSAECISRSLRRLSSSRPRLLSAGLAARTLVEAEFDRRSYGERIRGLLGSLPTGLLPPGASLS